MPSSHTKHVSSRSRKASSAGFLDSMGRFFASRRKVGLREKAYFFELFAVMVDAGIPILKTLEVLSEKTKNERFRQVIFTVIASIEHGDKLSGALSKFPNIFTEVEVGIIQSGELTGSLNMVMIKLAEDINKTLELHMKIRQALTYPITILIVLGLAVFIILGVVIPPLKNLFDSINSEIPSSLSILIDANVFIQKNIIFIVLLLVIAIGFTITYARTDRGRYRWDYIKLSIPYVRDIIRKIVLIRFVRSLSILLDSGLPLVKTLKTTAMSVGNEIYRMALLEVLAEIQKGQRISEALEKFPTLFPPDLTQIVAVGEKTATISSSTQKVAAQYEREIDHTLKNLTNVVEPIAIIAVGAIVGWFAFVVLGSIFSITEQLG